MSFYEVKVVDKFGVVIDTFAADGREGATVEQVTWALNEPGSATIRIPVHHPAADSIVRLTTEVQVWRDGAIIFWGVPVQRTGGDASVTWTCSGLLWYFTQRVFGPIGTNYLSNPNFTSNLTGWTAVGATATHSTAIRIRGPGTARLVGTASGDNYLQQTFTVSTGSIGLFLQAAAWFWPDQSVGGLFASPALEERGLYIDATNSEEGLPQWAPITMNMRTGKPQRLETGIHLEPNLTNEVVTVRLYAPNGTIHWGATSVTAMESVSSEPEGTDIATMMSRIVDYAQNGAGKSALNIGWTTPAAGVKEITAYQYMDLGNIFAALQTYPARGLADFQVVITSTTRTFTTYAPKKGSLKAGNALTVPGPGVLTMGHSLDGQQTATKKIVRGAGDGSDRELGVATDTSLLGGLVLESVSDAPPEITIDGLDAIAAADLAKLRDAATIPTATVAAAGWIGTVEPGDTVPVTYNWGAIQESSNRRVLQMTLNPVSDTVAVGLGVA